MYLVRAERVEFLQGAITIETGPRVHASPGSSLRLCGRPQNRSTFSRIASTTAENQSPKRGGSMASG